MKNTLLFLACLWLDLSAVAQKKWDGNAGDGQWSSASNWSPDGVPDATDEVILDHEFITVGYTVLLPSGTAATTVKNLRIQPSGGELIGLELPASNTSDPGFRVTGAGEALILSPGARLVNASGASTGIGIVIDNLMRIENDGRYIHRTSRGNAAIIDHLSATAGTERGIFEFDVPGAAGYTLSLTGNHFGTLLLRANAAGGNKSYSGSGASPLTIHGDLIIESGTNMTSTMNADILLAGDLIVKGKLNLNPSTFGTINRSLLFNGTETQNLSGNGTLSLGTNFRNLEIAAYSTLKLERDVMLSTNAQTFLIGSDGVLLTSTHIISGTGVFQNGGNSHLHIGATDGIMRTAPGGNIQTMQRVFNTDGHYYYDGSGEQLSGDGLPETIRSLVVDKPGSKLLLSTPVRIQTQLSLLNGNIVTNQIQSLTLGNGCVIQSPANLYGLSNSGWESSFIEGPLSLEIGNTEPVYAPVGKDLLFAPLIIQKVNNTTSVYTVEYFNDSYLDIQTVSDPPLDHVSGLEYWDIRSSGSNDEDDAVLTLSWRPVSGVGATTGEREDLRVAHYCDRGAGIMWNLEGSEPLLGGTAEYGLISTASPVADFSPFTLASSSRNNVLPLQLLSVTGIDFDDKITIQWTVSDDREILEYRVEKKEKENRFRRLGAVTPFGENAVMHYRFEDIHPNPGLNQYRLAMLDRAGNLRYSAIFSVMAKNENGISLSPNPVEDMLNINFQSPSSYYKLDIVNTSGQVVKRLQIHPLSQLTVNVRNFPPGIYWVRIWSGNTFETKIFLKR